MAGKTLSVTDAVGRVFTTEYDRFGNLRRVTHANVSPPKTVAEYTYYTSGAANGRVWSVSDGLSGVGQTIAYFDAPGQGQHTQVSSVVESGNGIGPAQAEGFSERPSQPSTYGF